MISSSGLLSKLDINCKVERPKKQGIKVQNYVTKVLNIKGDDKGSKANRMQ